MSIASPRRPDPDPAEQAEQRRDVTAGSELFVQAVVADPTVMVQTIAELNLPVHDERDLARLLHRAARAAAAWLPSADWMGLGVTFDGETLAAVDTELGELDRAQQLSGQGPSAVAAPLIDRGQVRGAITLYSRGAHGFPAGTTERLQVLAALVGRGLAEYRAVTDARTLAAQLQEAMRSRASIEQAKGVLMAVRRVSDETAFDLLRVESQKTNTKLRDVAAQLVSRLAQPG